MFQGARSFVTFLALFKQSQTTSTVGISAVPPKGCRTELNNTFPNLSTVALLRKSAYFLYVSANLPPNQKPMQSFDEVSLKKVDSTRLEPFDVKVGVHQGSIPRPLLFTLVIDEGTKDIGEGVVKKMLYADDLVLGGDNNKRSTLDTLDEKKHYKINE